MIIKQMILNNFRQFKGEHIINFSTSADKNVTVVMGDNGAGKTTLEKAFLWALYGKNEFDVKILINNDVALEIGNKYENAIAGVGLNIYFNKRNYRLIRQQMYKRSGRKIIVEPATVSLDVQNENGDWKIINKLSIDITIRDMLPEYLYQFFFFDGEHLESLSNDLLRKKKSEEFRNAVRGLVGLKDIEEAIKHLGNSASVGQNTVIGLINREIDKNADAMVSQCIQSINQLTIRLDSIDKELESRDKEYETLIRKKVDAQAELDNMQNDIDRREEYDKIGRKITEYRKKKDETLKGYFRLFSKNISSFYRKELYNDVLLEISKYVVEVNEKNKTSNLPEAVKGIDAVAINRILERGRCICGSKIIEGNGCYNSLKLLINSMPPYSIDALLKPFVNNIRSDNRSVDDFTENITTLQNNILDYEERINRLENERSRYQDDLSDREKVNSLRERIRNYTYQAENAKKLIGKLQVELADVKSKLKSEGNRKDELLARDAINRINKKYLNYAIKLSESMNETYSEKEEKTRIKLQNEINSIFENIYDGDISINVSEKYAVTTNIINTTFAVDELERNTAQNYAIIFAFISAIIQLAKHNSEYTDGFPMVMDAPLSAFDKTRIRKICDNLPNIAEQLIIFIKDTDGDIANKYLDDKIEYKYLLKANSKTVTSIERV